MTVSIDLNDSRFRDNSAHYEKLFENVPVMLHSTNAEGELTDVNDLWLQTMGYTRDEVLGKDARQFLTSDSLARVNQTTLARLLKNGSIINVPYQAIKKNGEIIHILVNSYVERNTDGSISGTYTLVIDVTETDELKEALSLSDIILKNVQSIVLVANGLGKIEYINPYTAKLLGFERAALLGDGWWRLVKKENWKEKDKVAAQATGQRVIEEGSYESIIYDIQGRKHWILFNDTPGPEGKLIGVGYDITEQKEAREQARRVNARMKIMLEIEKSFLSAKSQEETLYQVLTALTEHLTFCNNIHFSTFDVQRDEVQIYRADQTKKNRVFAQSYYAHCSF